MSTLYELAVEMRHVSDQLDRLEVDESLNGHTEEALQSLLAAVQVDAEMKIASLVRWRENLNAEAEALDKEITILKARRDAKRKRAEGIKSYIAQFMNTVKMPKFDAGIRSLFFRKGSVSTLADENEVLNWSPEFYETAVKTGALIERYDIKVSKLKEIPGYLNQAGVKEVVGEETLVIK